MKENDIKLLTNNYNILTKNLQKHGFLVYYDGHSQIACKLNKNRTIDENSKIYIKKYFNKFYCITHRTIENKHIYNIYYHNGFCEFTTNLEYNKDTNILEDLDIIAEYGIDTFYFITGNKRHIDIITQEFIAD